jgi:diaminohydroxyphosphoribosylaminopyrimidine deaminase / 5-amino-6-(5-phosphoribosylamino)uracil reductase
MSAVEHETYMRRALALAQQAWGRTHPNPMVGAAIVEKGAVVAEGYHARDGGPHAERVALEALGRPPAEDATLYVTLEPCSTAGRTGACTAAILAAGLRRVVVGARDPNPAHAGRGLDVLRQAGVEVVEGVLDVACTDLNLIFNHWISTGRTLLAAKAAVTLDGRIACRTGDSKWITNEASRADVHRWRRLFPGIAVGAMTVLHDNPRLTARFEGEEMCPWRFVFDGLLRTVVDRHMPLLYTDAFRDRTVVVTTPHAGLGYVRKLRDLGVQVWILPSPTQRVSFTDFRARCAAEKITGVYFEGGALLLSELLRSRELDYLFAYRAPILLADAKAKDLFGGLRTEKLNQAVRLAEVRHEQFGEDDLMRGRVVYPSKLLVDEASVGLLRNDE